MDLHIFFIIEKAAQAGTFIEPILPAQLKGSLWVRFKQALEGDRQSSVSL